MGIFKDKGVWDESHIPDVVLYRHEQIEKLRYYLDPLLSSCRAYNALCIGDYGTGKTVVVHHVRKSILADAQKQGKKILIYYINCSSFRMQKTNISTGRIYTLFLRDNGIKAYHTLPNELLLSMMKNLIEKQDGCVIILDEVDCYIESKRQDFERIAYAVSRELPKTSLILITNKFFVSKYLQNEIDPAVQETFTRNLKTVAFGDYSEHELKDILHERAKSGWQANVYDEHTLERMANISFNQGWKARGIISLGKQCGDAAEHEGMGRIEDWLIDSIAKLKPNRDLAQIIYSLDPPMKSILGCLITQPQTWVREDELKRWFISREKDLHLIKGTSDSTFYHSIGKLRGMCVIDREVMSRGRGKGTYGRLRVNPANVDLVRETLGVADDEQGGKK